MTDFLFYDLKKSIKLKEVAVDQRDFERNMRDEEIKVPPGSSWFSRSLMCSTSKQNASANDIKQDCEER